jgi:hypothetical protein
LTGCWAAGEFYIQVVLPGRQLYSRALVPVSSCSGLIREDTYLTFGDRDDTYLTSRDFIRDDTYLTFWDRDDT